MDVLLLSPGFPAEMPHFTEALARLGARIIGVGEGPVEAFPDSTRAALSDYVQVPSLWDEEQVLRILEGRRLQFDRAECLWEPGVLLAARIRETFELPGLNVEQTIPFRDKGKMKERLDEAGIRTPRHARAATISAVIEAVDEIGYPLILKPIAGAGSLDTHRVNDTDGLREVLPQLHHVDEVSVEEYIDGEEYTFDTICADGRILFQNISWYRPRPLIGRSEEWISPQTVCLRDIETEELAPGRKMGHDVITALGFDTGFTHMEWFLKPDGEAVFGEIACRPPGARSVDIMNETTDADLFHAWAEAIYDGDFSEKIERPYNSAVIFKRAEGEGRIERIVGLERLQERYGDGIVDVDLLPIGARRRNWRQTLLSDGFLTVRDPDLDRLIEMADTIGSELRIFAG